MEEMDDMQFFQAATCTKNVKLMPIIVITVLKSKYLYKAMISTGGLCMLYKNCQCSQLRGSGLLFTGSKQATLY
ncbi:MAG: hypothetical protein ACI8PW_000110 [Methylophilaceae bacterium]|jgi:hypothetical protein